TTQEIELSTSKPDKDMSHTHRPSAPIIEDWVSDSEDDFMAEIQQNASSFVQLSEQVKTPRSSVKTVETSIAAANLKTPIPKPKSNGNSKNRKACFVCKSLGHLIKGCHFYEKKMTQTPVRNHAQRGNNQQYTRMTHSNNQRHVVPTTVLTKSKLVLITAARPVTTVVPKPLLTRPRQAKTVVTKPHSPSRRNINHSPSAKASTFHPKVTAAKAHMVNVVKGKWVWKPKCPILDHVSRNTSASMTLKRFDYNDALGRSKSGGKISGKDKIRTEKLDFDDVFFVKELKFNLFSISQMCDKKNSVLFTDTEYLVLSLSFKLPDENQVLLRVHRKNNMYNVDLKNIVPLVDLTCLFAKETLDKSNLWHRR
nr:ribonuclease H-like domain-containing protein [Tanacetum cinerariifolium]